MDTDWATKAFWAGHHGGGAVISGGGFPGPREAPQAVRSSSGRLLRSTVKPAREPGKGRKPGPLPPSRPGSRAQCCAPEPPPVTTAPCQGGCEAGLRLHSTQWVSESPRLRLAGTGCFPHLSPPTTQTAGALQAASDPQLLPRRRTGTCCVRLWAVPTSPAPYTAGEGPGLTPLSPGLGAEAWHWVQCGGAGSPRSLGPPSPVSQPSGPHRVRHLPAQLR